MKLSYDYVVKLGLSFVVSVASLHSGPSSYQNWNIPTVGASQALADNGSTPNFININVDGDLLREVIKNTFEDPNNSFSPSRRNGAQNDNSIVTINGQTVNGKPVINCDNYDNLAPVHQKKCDDIAAGNIDSTTTNNGYQYSYGEYQYDSTNAGGPGFHLKTAEVADEFKCNFFENNPYSTMLTSINAIGKELHATPDCGTGVTDKAVLQTIVENQRQINELVNKMNPFGKKPQNADGTAAVPGTDPSTITSPINTGSNNFFSGSPTTPGTDPTAMSHEEQAQFQMDAYNLSNLVSDTAQKITKNPLLTPACRKYISGSKQIAKNVLDLVSNTSPVLLAGLTLIPGIGIPARLIGGAALTLFSSSASTISSQLESSQNNEVNLRTPLDRQNLLNNVCQYSKISRKLRILKLAGANMIDSPSDVLNTYFMERLNELSYEDKEMNDFLQQRLEAENKLGEFHNALKAIDLNYIDMFKNARIQKLEKDADIDAHIKELSDASTGATDYNKLAGDDPVKLSSMRLLCAEYKDLAFGSGRKFYESLIEQSKVSQEGLKEIIRRVMKSEKAIKPPSMTEHTVVVRSRMAALEKMILGLDDTDPDRTEEEDVLDAQKISEDKLARDCAVRGRKLVIATKEAVTGNFSNLRQIRNSWDAIMSTKPSLAKWINKYKQFRDDVIQAQQVVASVSEFRKDDLDQTPVRVELEAAFQQVREKLLGTTRGNGMFVTMTGQATTPAVLGWLEFYKKQYENAMQEFRGTVTKLQKYSYELTGVKEQNEASGVTFTQQSQTAYSGAEEANEVRKKRQVIADLLMSSRRLETLTAERLTQVWKKNVEESKTKPDRTRVFPLDDRKKLVCSDLSIAWLKYNEMMDQWKLIKLMCKDILRTEINSMIHPKIQGYCQTQINLGNGQVTKDSLSSQFFSEAIKKDRDLGNISLFQMRKNITEKLKSFDCERVSPSLLLNVGSTPASPKTAATKDTKPTTTPIIKGLPTGINTENEQADPSLFKGK